ncbi:type III secretion protein [Brenneria roseae subsp. americana]|uniref:Type III secretion protein n=1 Tax=Brenneria roseae subsp. americana TaxID=1508507 RepID=A0A2U1TTU2_9GAMM|nr:type III secretion system HrpP C-terminal domain-containing protein [Brenneria roseae]PWC12810.1 type III secretion protein [Brenneria roseae subsp. americana]
MNNRLTSSPETAAPQALFSAQRSKSARLPDDGLHGNFWEAFTFSDGFEQAVQQEAPNHLPIAGLTPFTPVIPKDHGASAQYVTPSSWPPLQCELLEALDNIGYPPFSFSLQLPQLGDIDARLATLAPRGWDISLRFSRESYLGLKDRRESCRRALSDALGCPVNLNFDVRESCR